MGQHIKRVKNSFCRDLLYFIGMKSFQTENILKGNVYVNHTGKLLYSISNALDKNAALQFKLTYAHSCISVKYYHINH
jgi:hypothetical protein